MKSLMRSYTMNKTIWKLVTIVTTIAVTTGCVPPSAVPDKPTLETSIAAPTNAPMSTLTSLSTSTPPNFSEGPLLLIQTGFDAYHIIDISQKTTFPFDLPVDNGSLNLSRNLSLSGHLLFFQDEDQTIRVMDFTTWEVHSLENVYSDSPVFDPQRAAEEALETLPQLGYTLEGLRSALDETVSQSREILQWYQDDNTLLTVQGGSPTSTNLYQYNIETGTSTQLEDYPGLVQAVWAAPGGERVLIKKSYIFDTNIWQDDRFFVVDIEDQSVKPIPLPQDCKYPALSWLSPNDIGLIHQTQPQGGTGYSIINVNTMESTIILKGDFAQIRVLGENLLATFQNPDTRTTQFQWLNFKGEGIQAQTFDRLCRIIAIVNGKIILNCEEESLLMEEDLLLQSFSDPIFLLSPAPDNESIVLITRRDESFLLNMVFEEQQPLKLDGSPLEILWEPDASGFLYRTLGQLHTYDLANEQSHLLFTSDLFGDYTNLNAVWINTE
jgi:hypothetical protein